MVKIRMLAFSVAVDLQQLKRAWKNIESTGLKIEMWML